MPVLQPLRDASRVPNVACFATCGVRKRILSNQDAVVVVAVAAADQRHQDQDRRCSREAGKRRVQNRPPSDSSNPSCSILFGHANERKMLKSC